MEKSSTNNNVSWFSNHWVMILTAIIGGIFIIGILKILSQLFSSNGPISDGIKDLFDSGANLVNGLINGCEAQGECNSTDEKGCSSEQGCKWTPSTTSGQPGSCINNTGKPPTPGNFFSTSCILGMSEIFALCGAIVFFIIGPLIKKFVNKSNANLDTAVETGLAPRDEIYTRAVKTTQTDSEESKKLFEKQQQRASTDVEQRAIGKAQGLRASLDLAKKGIEGQSGVSAATKASITQNSEQVYNDAKNAHIKELTDQGMSEDNANKIYENVETDG